MTPGFAATSTSKIDVVLDHGADPTGATPSDAAFLAAYTAAMDSYTNPFSTCYHATKVIHVPAGNYVIKGNGQVMFNRTPLSSVAGIRFAGDGVDVTTIAFEPATANGYLCGNEDQMNNLAFENIAFHCSGPHAATADFMKSHVTTSGSSNFTFWRCKWDGTWQHGLDLTGTDGNDTMTWYSCTVRGEWVSFLHDGVDGSDQNVFFNFFGCSIEPTAGDFIDMARGGNINVYGASLIHVGNSGPTASSPQCFFRLRGATHNSGTCRLLVSGARVEHRHKQSQLIDCEWASGNITFQSCDTSSQAPLLTNPNNVVQAEFGHHYGYTPMIVFDGCSLMGVHRYRYNGAVNAHPSMVYRSCDVLTHSRVADLVTFVNDNPASNVAGVVPAAVFEHCRATSPGAGT